MCHELIILWRHVTNKAPRSMGTINYLGIFKEPTENIPYIIMIHGKPVVIGMKLGAQRMHSR